MSRFSSSMEAHAFGYAVQEYSMSDLSFRWLLPNGRIVRTTIHVPNQLNESKSFPNGLRVAKVEDVERFRIK